MTTPVQNDLGGNYLAYRSQLPDLSPGDALLKEVEGLENGKSGTPQAPSGAPPMPGASQHGIAYRVGADVLKGVMTEMPRAIYTGARDAVVNTYDAIDDFSKWADKKIGDATGFRGIAWDQGKGLRLMNDAEAGVGLAGQITGGKGTTRTIADSVRDAIDKTKLDPTNLITGAPMQSPTSTTGQLIKGIALLLARVARGS